MQKAKRDARETALNVLYQINVAGTPLGEALDAAFDHQHDLDAATHDYVRRLVFGTLDNLLDIDSKLRTVSIKWPPKRQSIVDRNILRIAVYEIDYVDSVPDVVAIDEAIELAKKYGSTESGRFISGILGDYLRQFVK
ncbi:MAG: transcription antitermination factor NusB [Armatimonadota bacterium]|nr:transcription antitermination factor NusB [Armatimonadota bacterium]